MYVDHSSVTGATSHAADVPYVILPARTRTSNRSASYRPSNRVASLVRSIGGDKKGDRGGVLRAADGLPARSHPDGSIQSLVDGLVVAMLAIFVVVVAAAVSLARRRRRRAVVAAASRSTDCDHVTMTDDEDDDNCAMELGEFITELEDDDEEEEDSETARYETSSPADWDYAEGGTEDYEEDRVLAADSASLTPLCARSVSTTESSVASGSTPSAETPLYWQTFPL